MGNYSKSISNRFKHTRIQEGYCLICDKYGRLSQDHVPPKGAITITRVEQRHISEMMEIGASNVKGVPSPNGSKFKTICHNCNNLHLGGNDNEVAKVYKSLTKLVKDYFFQGVSPYPIIYTNIDAIKFSRAMVGHILAATSVSECRDSPNNSSYFQPLKDFVCGDDDALANSHDIYYWYYPFNKHLSAKCVGFWDNGHVSTVSLLSFFPIAFMVTKKNQGTYPPHARQLLLTDKRITLNLDSRGYKFSEFPFHGLKGNQMMSLAEQQAIVSYPIGQ